MQQFSSSYPFMDIAFQLHHHDRHSFLQDVMQSFGCTYICLWSYLPQPSNCLRLSDAFLQEIEVQPCSYSAGSLAQFLFWEYRQLEFSVDDGLVPGLAYKHNDPCLVLEDYQLQTYASADVQRQFYVAARIKTSIFLGSINGEVELGFSDVSQVDIPMILSNLLPGNVAPKVPMELPRPVTKLKLQSEHQHTMDSQARSLQFLTPEALDEAMTRAILAVLSSPACSSSSSAHQSYNLNVKASAFKKYAGVLTPTAWMKRNSSSRQSLLKRSFAFMKNLNLARLQERIPTTSRPTSSQLHHVISERRRREKLNDSFRGLKTILPPGTKKDKGSVLTTAKEYMCSLKAQVAGLSQRNQQLEAQLLQSAKEGTSVFSQEERFRIQISQVPESTSEGQIIDMHVATRGESPLTNIVNGVLEFLKQLNNVRVVSMEGNTQLTASSSINHLTLRLIIKENAKWHESALKEAVERVVSDLAR